VKRVGRSLIGLLGAVVISAIVWDQIETRALDREIAEIAARGEPTSAPDPESVELTNEQREAARWYAGAAERAKQATSGDGPAFGLSRVDIDNPAIQADLAQLEGKFRSDAPALQLLDRATPLDFKEFGAEAPELYTNQGSLSQLAHLNDVRADLLAARGQTDAAAQTLVASVRLLRTMPTSFYRFQATTHFLGSLRILFRRAPAGEAALAPLQRELMALPDDDTLAREVLRTRGTFLDRIAEPATSPFDAVAKRLTRPIRARAARRHLAAYDESLALAATPWPARMAAGRIFEAKYEPVIRGARSLGWWQWIAKPYGPAVVPIAVNAAGLELASRRVAVAAIAIERYRRAHAEMPPPALDALVPTYLPSVPMDPFTGAPLIYRVTPAGYSLHSTDVDERDDGGALYGRGSRNQAAPRAGQPRDLGIRVDWKR
jgi:hypothetical protein